MKGRGLAIAILAALVLWAWSKQAKAAVTGAAVPKVQTTIQTYTGAPGEIAPVVSTARNFAIAYNMSESAAIATAQRYAANPSSVEFAGLSSVDKANLARVAASLSPLSTVGAPPPPSGGGAPTVSSDLVAYSQAVAVVEASGGTSVLGWSVAEGYHAVEVGSAEYQYL